LLKKSVPVTAAALRDDWPSRVSMVPVRADGSGPSRRPT
jgi:hypothetical protein